MKINDITFTLKIHHFLIILVASSISCHSMDHEKSIENINNDKFISYRKLEDKWKQIAICYNIATPKIWGNIFNINTITDVENVLIKEFKKNIKWTTDQIRLFEIIKEWDKIFNNHIFLDNKCNRLDRSKFNIISNSIIHNIKMGVYTDYHMHRPYSNYKDLINKVVNHL